MGAQATKLAQKGYGYIRGDSSNPEEDSSLAVSRRQGMQVKATAFVLTRSSSMYFDEDGQLAHEFYIETRSKPGKKLRLKRKKSGLTPQGIVPLKIPRLHADYPIILYEAR